MAPTLQMRRSRHGREEGWPDSYCRLSLIGHCPMEEARDRICWGAWGRTGGGQGRLSVGPLPGREGASSGRLPVLATAGVRAAEGRGLLLLYSSVVKSSPTSYHLPPSLPWRASVTSPFRKIAHPCPASGISGEDEVRSLTKKRAAQCGCNSTHGSGAG